MDGMTGNFAVLAAYIFLIFLRITSTFVLSPLFGKNVPGTVKIMLSIVLSYIVTTVFPPQIDYAYNTVIEYVIICIKEIFLGLTFSIISTMFFSIVYTAGQMIDLQLGFSFAQIYDTKSNIHVPVTGSFLHIVLITVFFLVDGHHVFFKILHSTFYQIPPGTVSFNLEMVKIIIEVFIMTFSLSLKIAMPILAVSLIVELLLGIIMKTIPNMNFFVIGFPIKIAVGFLVLITFIPVFINAHDYIFDNMFRSIMKVFEGMSSI